MAASALWHVKQRPPNKKHHTGTKPLHLQLLSDNEPRFEVTDVGLGALASADAVAPDIEMASVAAE